MRVRSRIALFLSGSVAVLLVVAALVIAGVIPVKETTVIERQTQAVTSTTAADASKATETSLADASSPRSLTPSQIYDKYANGVVEVLATFTTSGDSMFQMGGTQSSQALGSGFVVDTDGYILTNAHVVVDSGTPADSVAVVFKDGDSEETTRVVATVVGVDESSDVALLKVDPAKAPTLTPIPLGDSSTAQVGGSVVAIGNPLGYDFSLTEGVISALHRTLQSPNGSVIADGIQTDAAINEGNSGGPLIDSSGKVIGINEQIATSSSSGGSDGLGFAVPINTAIDVMDQLKTSGKVTYAYLGVQGQTLTADVAHLLGLDAEQGVLVAAVSDGSPAADAGLQGGDQQQALQSQVYVTGGDVITAVGGKALDSMEDLAALITQHKPGDELTLTVQRGDDTKQINVTLAERPNSL